LVNRYQHFEGPCLPHCQVAGFSKTSGIANQHGLVPEDEKSYCMPVEIALKRGKNNLTVSNL
jgi:hypothetical protein